MLEQPEKFDLTSGTIIDEQKAKLKLLFPEVFTEGGKIDFDRFRLTLGETVDTGKERYGMNWPGKADCFKNIQSPSMATLVPSRKESVNFNTTENLIIEGDNLETLKLLQKAYLGKVKMIYIDPPYNTGSDFIYPDDYSESLGTYLRYTGQVDEEGRKFSTNTEADGRFHSKWMNMMYPRLYLARNLLREDGIIFISIDDHEVDNLRKLCNEIFGEENFRGCVTRKTGTPTGQGNEILVNEIDYVLIFSKSDSGIMEGLTLTEEDERIYDKQDTAGRYLTRPLRKTGGEDRKEDRPTMHFAIEAPDGTKVWPIGPGGYASRWRCGPDTYKRLLSEGLVEWKKTDDEGRAKWTPYQKFYLEGRKKQPSNLWTEIEGNKKASIDLKKLLGDNVFDFPKPVELIQRILAIGSSTDALVLDFFAGSGTTAHAVLAQNKEDGGSRKFILVQLPEPTEKKDFATIAEITKERVRRVVKKLNDEDGGKLKLEGGGQPDRGFRVFKLQTSNFKPWNANYPKDDAQLVKQLQLHVDHLVEGRSQEDVLYELLLKSGFPLDSKIEEITLAGKSVFSLADDAMLICLDKELSPEVIKAMAEKKPERVVCLDAGFAENDQLKTNAVQTMKAKGVTKFQTV